MKDHTFKSIWAAPIVLMGLRKGGGGDRYKLGELGKWERIRRSGEESDIQRFYTMPGVVV